MSRRKTSKEEGCNSRAHQGTTGTDKVQMVSKKLDSGVEASELFSPGSDPSTTPLIERRSVGTVKTFEIHEGDLPSDVAVKLCQAHELSIDTETDGLDFRIHPLRYVMLYHNGAVHVVKNATPVSLYLAAVLKAPLSIKLFHNALFDLQFIKAWTGIEVCGPVHCTKTLMKMLRPSSLSGLGSALRTVIGVKINKKIDHNKWKNSHLSARQKEYMSNDVRYLPTLAKTLIGSARPGFLDRYQDAMMAIKLKAFLEVEGYTDLLGYEQETPKKTDELRQWWARQAIRYRGATC